MLHRAHHIVSSPASRQHAACSTSQAPSCVVKQHRGGNAPHCRSAHSKTGNAGAKGPFCSTPAVVDQGSEPPPIQEKFNETAGLSWSMAEAETCSNSAQQQSRARPQFGSCRTEAEQQLSAACRCARGLGAPVAKESHPAATCPSALLFTFSSELAEVRLGRSAACASLRLLAVPVQRPLIL